LGKGDNTVSNKKQKKRQDKLLKRKRRAKARQKKQSAAVQVGSHGVLQKARQFSIFDCQISADWQGDLGLVQIVVARQQPDKKIAYGIFLVDKFCLGLKNTSYDANLSVEEYKYVVRTLDQTTPMTKCSLELAHQFVYEAIDYADQYGFKPQKDYKWSRLILEPRGTLETSYKLTFGKDGKPFYVSGPYDNPQAIIAKLEKTAGQGNYDYLIQAGDPALGEDMLMFDDETDDQEPGED
jgi:hypothetical protein